MRMTNEIHPLPSATWAVIGGGLLVLAQDAGSAGAYVCAFLTAGYCFVASEVASATSLKRRFRPLRAVNAWLHKEVRSAAREDWHW